MEGVGLGEVAGVQRPWLALGTRTRCGGRPPSLGPVTIRRANAVHPITAVQTEYSLRTRDPEAKVLPACRELGIGFVPYSPLGRGFLAGRFSSPDELDEKDFRRTGPASPARTSRRTSGWPRR